MNGQDILDDTLVSKIKNLPTSPGVYQFKNEKDEIIYIGKAKNLRSRVLNYLTRDHFHLKEASIMAEATAIEHIPTATELEAMLLEAKLIQSIKPKHNVIFKEGQPFLYIFISQGSKKDLSKLLLTRNKKRKGTYFGPFMEKSSVRKVYDFLIKTFNLKLCNKKIEQGCLYYHLGMCAGSCRSNFDKQAYLDRLTLAKKSLKQGHKEFLLYLKQCIKESNQKQEYERSRDFYSYYQAFERVFESLKIDMADVDAMASKDVWVFLPENKTLFLFAEKDGVLKKRRVFYHVLSEVEEPPLDDLTSYYRSCPPPALILVNFRLEQEEKLLIEEFLHKWHKCRYKVALVYPEEDNHYARVLRLAVVQAKEAERRSISSAVALKRLLKLTCEPHVIDCFDVSHKQGMFLVGSCVRFVDGKPAKEKFRRFKIKTVKKSDDYASLREIVQRRYSKDNDFPDLILIDGGKGQLNAVKDLYPDVAFASLAKREETVYAENIPEGKVLDQRTYTAHILMALRDYAHHFALSYHRRLATKIS